MDFRKHPRTRFKDVKKLTKGEAREQVEVLRQGIEYHDYLYYVKNAPEISDATYDKLFKRLQELEKAFPEFDSENSPTKRVGAKPVRELPKVRHASPMLSLNAVYDDEDVEDFDRMVLREMGGKKVEYVAEPKFDGLSVEVVYEDGVFTRGATRGDGQTGEDISRNVRTIRTVPLHLRNGKQGIPSFLAVRGEVFMRKDDFQKLNKHRIENGREPFANPRNAAAGTVRQLDPGEVAKIPLDIVFYDILEVRGRSFASHWEMLNQLPRWGLRTDPHNQKCAGLDQVRKYHARMAERRDDLDYEVDGIVIKLNDYEAQEKLGTRQRSPRWALAWKFSPKQDVTVLQDIVVQVGRTGILTPVALLDSVNVGGVTVSRATLHNEDEARRKDVRPGDKVRIERAGDVIPEVVGRIEQPGKKRSEPFSMPETCPACGTKVRREGAYYYCPASLTCPPQLIARITHYASRNALDIQGLGHETTRELVERGMVRTIADLYDLSVDDLEQLEGFAEKSARQVHDAIRKAKKVRMDRFVYALGIRDVGEHVAQVLARHFKTVEALETATIEELDAVEEIGSGTAESIYSFFHQKQNREVLDRLHDAGVRVEPMPSRQRAGPLQGKTFVFTGALEGYTRDEAQRRVEGLGGRATSHVSGNTDYVVVGRDPGSRLDEARKRSIKTVDEKEFRELVSI